MVARNETIEPSAGGEARHGRMRRYGPLAFWMALIFFASTGTFSAANTSSILRPLMLWLFPHASEASIDLAHFLVRKAAHFTEYAVFGLLAARAFTGSSHDALRRGWFFVALLLVIFYSLFDEFHQSFVPSRTASIYDSLLDTSGGFTTLLLCAARRKLKSRTRRPR